MASGTAKPFSAIVAVLHQRPLPEPATPVGYAALIDAYGIKAPLPRRLSVIGKKHKNFERDGWRYFTPRYMPQPTLEGHLVFALKHEGLELAVLKRLFLACGPDAIAELVRHRPTSAYARRIWFLFEWLLDHRLDLSDADRGTYIRIIDPDIQFASGDLRVSRHRVHNNLPGTAAFCPLVFRTAKLQGFIAQGLQERAQEVVDAVPKDLLARAAAFLLLKDSRSSYAIEGESAPHDRIQRWGLTIGEAGRHPLTLDELLRLQRIVIGDARFVRLGLRTKGGFVGEHDRDTRAPLPDHISARPEDLRSLIEGMAAFDRIGAKALDPVIAAAVLAFGFVYVHPFEDGNGRIHRYLIHHVLAERHFNPPAVVFPVSAAILARIHDYKRTLESYSSRLLPFSDWVATDDGNVRVLNDTGDFFRYFDATPHAEFLFECVNRTIEHDLPREVDFLRRHDQFSAEINGIVDMPARMIDLMFRFLQQNRGRLSKRAREQELSALSAAEIHRIEAIYIDLFGKTGIADTDATQ